MEIALLIILALFALSLQIFATLGVRRSPSFGSEQKRRQFTLIWALPVLGATMVLSILHQDGDLFAKNKTNQQISKSLSNQTSTKTFSSLCGLPQGDFSIPSTTLELFLRQFYRLSGGLLRELQSLLFFKQTIFFSEVLSIARLFSFRPPFYLY
jgi:hypothetical protein